MFGFVTEKRREPTQGSDSAAPEPERSGARLLSSLLDAPAWAAPAFGSPPPGTCLVGTCVDERHPSLFGRARIRWETLDGAGDAWLPVLASVVVRNADQVLLTQPANGPEPVVVGVVDGFAHRPPAPERTAARLALENDEVLAVEDARGQPLLEVRASPRGPRVRLRQKDLAVEVEGTLAFRADAIQMQARGGRVEIEASDDVCVKGEVVHLN